MNAEMTDIIEVMDAAYDLHLWGPKKGGSCESGRQAMRAAVAAAAERGYVVTRAEPDVAMTKAAIEADDTRTGAETCKHIYRAMIAAGRVG